MRYLSPVIVPNATNPRTGSGMQQARKPRAEQAVKQERDLRGGTRLDGLAPIDRRRVFPSSQGLGPPSETKAHREDGRTGSGRAVQQRHRDHLGGPGGDTALETPAGFGQHGKPPDGPELGTSCERGLPRRRTERQRPISAARDSPPGASRAVDIPCMQSGIDPRCEGLFGSDLRKQGARRERELRAESRHPQLERRVGWTPRERTRRKPWTSRDGQRAQRAPVSDGDAGGGEEPDQETSREATLETGLSEARPCDARARARVSTWREDIAAQQSCWDGMDDASELERRRRSHLLADGRPGQSRLRVSRR